VTGVALDCAVTDGGEFARVNQRETKRTLACVLMAELKLRTPKMRGASTVCASSAEVSSAWLRTLEPQRVAQLRL
jgi:hypothetical protein